jgi:hypothetical protein
LTLVYDNFCPLASGNANVNRVIIIDHLQPDGAQRGLYARWAEQGIFASADVEPIKDNSRRNYALECGEDRDARSGTTGRRPPSDDHQEKATQGHCQYQPSSQD